MSNFVRFVRGLLADLVRPRVRLIAENTLLRQQLIVAERKIVDRVRWAPRRSRLSLIRRVFAAASSWLASLLVGYIRRDAYTCPAPCRRPDSVARADRGPREERNSHRAMRVM